MKLRFLSIILLFGVVLSACAPVAQPGDITGKSAMQLIYDLTESTVKGAWGMTGWIAGIFLGVALGLFLARVTAERYDEFNGVTFVIALVVAIVFCVGVSGIIGNMQSQTIATHAVEVGADRAKTRRANQYIEKLHIPATKAVLEFRTCEERNNGSTGCRYEWTYDWNYHQDCEMVDDKDSEGNVTGSHQECTPDWDTMHVPFFTQEWRTYAYFSMPDKYLLNKVEEDAGTGLMKSDVANMPMRYYSDWQAPEDFNNYWYGPDNRNGHSPDSIGSFEYQIPEEWKMIDASLRAGRPYVITVWHSYVNWVFITADSNNLVATSSQVEKYLAADLLPQVNSIYSRYGTANPGLHQDYDYVQFRGGLQVEDSLNWQDMAALYALNVGPRLQGSMLVWFVPSESVDSPDAWILAAKAYLSDVDTWGFYMAPKNLILIGCGVNQETNVIEFCRMETGMPTGNVEIRNTVGHITGVPFTTQGVFGTLSPTAVPDANGFYVSDLPIAQDGMLAVLFGRTAAQIEQMKIDDPELAQWFIDNAPDQFGFLRIGMSTLDWLKTDIKLEAEDISWVIETETAAMRKATGWLNAVVIVFALIIVAVTYSDKFTG